MLSREHISGDVARGHFHIEKAEWEELERHITTSKSQFIRDYIKRVNRQSDDLDELYVKMVEKRKELRLLELEIEDLLIRINELEEWNKSRNVDVS